MADLTATEMAKAFVKAVDSQSLQKQAEFLLNASEDELFGILGASLTADGETPASEDDIPAENFLYKADIFAAIAERTGQSAAFKQLLPAGAITEQARTELAQTAPNFAKLAL